MDTVGLVISLVCLFWTFFFFFGGLLQPREPRDVRLLKRQIRISTKRGDPELKREILEDELELAEMEAFYSTDYGKLYPEEYRNSMLQSIKTSQRIEPCYVCGRLVKLKHMSTHQETDEFCKSEAERQAKERAEKWEQEEAERRKADERSLQRVKWEAIANKETEKRSRRVSTEVKRAVFERDEGKCVKCGSSENIEYDHDIPFSKGGSNGVRNIQLLCKECNRQKSNKIM
jgi:hypothetical protein